MMKYLLRHIPLLPSLYKKPCNDVSGKLDVIALVKLSLLLTSMRLSVAFSGFALHTLRF